MLHEVHFWVTVSLLTTCLPPKGQRGSGIREAEFPWLVTIVSFAYCYLNWVSFRVCFACVLLRHGVAALHSLDWVTKRRDNRVICETWPKMKHNDLHVCRIGGSPFLYNLDQGRNVNRACVRTCDRSELRWNPHCFNRQRIVPFMSLTYPSALSMPRQSHCDVNKVAPCWASHPHRVYTHHLTSHYILLHTLLYDDTLTGSHTHNREQTHTPTRSGVL